MTSDRAAPDAEDPIVVSGIGLISPLGSSRETTWTSLLRGDRAGVWLDVMTGSRWFGAPVMGALPSGQDPILAMADRVAREALADARWSSDAVAPERVGVVFGTSKGSFPAVTQAWQATRLREAGSGECDPFRIYWPSSAAEVVSRAAGATGPRLSPVAACATGLVAIQRGVELLRAGDCEVVLAGSADDSLHPLVLSSFQRMGVLARGDDPASASRPFDRGRTGMMIGAGAGCLVLERRSQARARGVTAYARIDRGRRSSDPTGLTTLDASGESLVRLLRDTVPCGATPEAVHLHGTGTRLNDPAECRAIRRVLGPAMERVACGSFKGNLGHLLGAAGSVELGLCCLALRDQIWPANGNLDDLDPECDLPLVRGAAQPMSLNSLLKISLGFGGHQAAVWLTRGDRVSAISRT